MHNALHSKTCTHKSAFCVPQWVRTAIRIHLGFVIKWQLDLPVLYQTTRPHASARKSPTTNQYATYVWQATFSDLDTAWSCRLRCGSTSGFSALATCGGCDISNTSKLDCIQAEEVRQGQKVINEMITCLYKPNGDNNWGLFTAVPPSFHHSDQFFGFTRQYASK